MIINLLIGLITLILGAIFSWLPIVTTLPTIAGFDIDGALVTGMGQFNTFVTTFWPLDYMFKAFLVLMGYYGLKMLITFFLGHRAPGTK
jgi:ABC-type phosphate/phosphonate transport system permease subunit